MLQVAEFWGFGHWDSFKGDPYFIYIYIYTHTRWFKYDWDYLCVNKSQFVPVIFEAPCIYVCVYIYIYIYIYVYIVAFLGAFVQ
jgi:hypothetical protein